MSAWILPLNNCCHVTIVNVDVIIADGYVPLRCFHEINKKTKLPWGYLLSGARVTLVIRGKGVTLIYLLHSSFTT